MAACDGPNCGAEIIWAVTVDGKRQPFDREPDERKGNTLLLGRGPDLPPLAISSKMLAMSVPQRKVGLGWIRGNGAAYVPHHATCPDVEKFRRTG